MLGARSLYDQAKSATIRHIDLLTDVGDLPYSFLRPVLLRLENPNQLRDLEKTCPQLLGEDGELWLQFIKRDIPKWENRAHEPKDPRLWYKVYRKLVQDVAVETRQAEDVLKQKMAVLAAKREANTLAAPTMMIPEKAPKKRAQAFSKTADKSVLRFTSGSKTRNVIERAKRETAEARLRRQGALTTPTHLLQTGRIMKAPQVMIDNRREEVNRPAAFKISRPATSAAGRAPRRPPPAPSQALADREARLKALQAGSAGGSAFSSHTPLAQGTSYKVPALGRTASPMPRSSSPMVRPGTPPKAVKRKREADIFMPAKRR